jgi:hypothetical protein
VLAGVVAGVLVAALRWVCGVLPPGGDGVTTTVLRAYRFAVDPAPAQDVVLRSDCGAQRPFSGIRAGELTPAVPWSAYSLRKRWNQAEDETALWWGENSTEAYSSGLANLATAPAPLVRVASGHPGRPGAEVSSVQGQAGGSSCQLATGDLAEADRRHVKLPRIGLVRTHESTRTLARHIERGTARIRSATVAGRTAVLFRTPRPGPGPTGFGGGCRPRDQVPGGALHRGGYRQPRAAWRSPNGSCAGCSAKPPGVPAPTRPPGGGTPARAPSRCPRGGGVRLRPGSPACTPP